MTGLRLTRFARLSRLTWVLSALTLAGVVATIAAFNAAATTSRRQRDGVMDVLLERVSARSRASLAGLRGVSALAVDGEVTEAEFSTFAAEVMKGSVYAALAYSDVIRPDQVASWEARYGFGVGGAPGPGAPSLGRLPEFFAPVRLVHPANDLARSVRGFDISSDALRADGLRQSIATGEPVVVGPVRLAVSGRPGLYAINAVRNGANQVVGAVSSGISPGGLLDDLGELHGIEQTRISLTVDGAVLADGGERGARRSFSLGGRTIGLEARVRGVTGQGPLAWLTLAGTVVVALAAAAAGIGDHRLRRARHEAAERDLVVARLRASLADVTTADELAAVVAGHVAALADADHVELARLDPGDPSRVLVHGAAGPHELAIADELPLTTCIRHGTAVTVQGPDTGRPDVGTIVCLPISGPAGTSGALLLAWRGSDGRGDADEPAGALATATEAIGRALERVQVRDAVEIGARRLRELAAGVSAASTPQALGALVADQLPGLLGTVQAELALDAPGGVVAGTRAYPIGHDQNAATVLVRVEPGTPWTPTHEAVMSTVVELLDAAWTRSRQHEQEHAVLTRIQQSLLTPAPHLDEMAVAVRYVSALDTVGLGGDWYSVVERDDAVFLVVGDVAGHGAGAVALMAELKSIIRHVLLAGATLEEASRHADTILARRDGYASAVLVEIGRGSPTLSYLNAGHPPPLLRTHAGVQVLGDIHRPWLGTPGAGACPTEHDFAPGDLLLLYTDGLVERRDEPIDTGIERLGRRLAHADGLDRLLDELVDSSRERVDRGYIDDDIAILGVVRSSG